MQTGASVPTVHSRAVEVMWTIWRVNRKCTQKASGHAPISRSQLCHRFQLYIEKVPREDILIAIHNIIPVAMPWICLSLGTA